MKIRFLMLLILGFFNFTVHAVTDLPLIGTWKLDMDRPPVYGQLNNLIRPYKQNYIHFTHNQITEFSSVGESGPTYTADYSVLGPESIYINMRVYKYEYNYSPSYYKIEGNRLTLCEDHSKQFCTTYVRESRPRPTGSHPVPVSKLVWSVEFPDKTYSGELTDPTTVFPNNYEGQVFKNVRLVKFHPTHLDQVYLSVHLLIQHLLPGPMKTSNYGFVPVLSLQRGNLSATYMSKWATDPVAGLSLFFPEKKVECEKVLDTVEVPMFPVKIKFKFI